MSPGKTILLPLVGTNGRILPSGDAGPRYAVRGRATQDPAGARDAKDSASSWFWTGLRPLTRGWQLVSDLVGRGNTRGYGFARKHFVPANLDQELIGTSR
jgi:hypothetical protein